MFVVMDAVVRERKSWVMWVEGHAPDVVIELVSESTETEDRGRKKRICGRWLHIPVYCIHDPFRGTLDAYVLDGGSGDYVSAPRSADGGVLTPLGLELAVWQGTWKNVTAPWLRWREVGGAWLPTPEEEVALARQQADEEKQRAAAAEDRMRRLEARLLALGVDPGV